MKIISKRIITWICTVSFILTFFPACTVSCGAEKISVSGMSAVFGVTYNGRKVEDGSLTYLLLFLLPLVAAAVCCMLRSSAKAACLTAAACCSVKFAMRIAMITRVREMARLYESGPNLLSVNTTLWHKLDLLLLAVVVALCAGVLLGKLSWDGNDVRAAARHPGRLCPICDASAPDGAFCTRCGTKLSEE